MYKREHTLKYPYFYCGLNGSAPWLKNKDLAVSYMIVANMIKKRHEKLAEAFELCRDKPMLNYVEQEEAFSEYAADVFRKNPDSFDDMSSRELAAAVSILYDGRILPERVDWAGAEPLFDIRFATTKEWELLRYASIGGSETATVQGVNSHECPLSLYHRKIGTPMKDEFGYQLERGHVEEDRVRQWICEQLGLVVVPEYRMFRSKKYPNVSANLDGILYDPVKGDYSTFEAKTASAGMKIAWAGNRVPQNYLCQINQYCGVLDDARITRKLICAFIFAEEYSAEKEGYWFGGAENERIFRIVERDPAEEQRICSEAQDFWEQYIATGNPPTAEYTEAETELAEKLRAAAEPDPENIEIDLKASGNEETASSLKSYLTLSERMDKAKKVVKQLEKDMKACESVLLMAMGNHEQATLLDTDGRKYNTTYVSGRMVKKVNYDAISLRGLEDALISYEPSKPSFRIKEA